MWLKGGARDSLRDMPEMRMMMSFRECLADDPLHLHRAVSVPEPPFAQDWAPQSATGQSKSYGDGPQTRLSPFPKMGGSIFMGS